MVFSQRLFLFLEMHTEALECHEICNLISNNTANTYIERVLNHGKILTIG